MLLSFIKNLLHARGIKQSPPLRLHIGGKTADAAWKVLDVQPGPHVDYVGHCSDLSAFGDNSVLEIYASHVIEHLGFVKELPLALREFHRALAPGGALRVSVPDLTVLCELFTDPALDFGERFQVMRMMFGGQLGDADFHYVGLNEEFLRDYLLDAGFVDIARTGNFGLFDDTSNMIFKGRPISLNLSARKPARN
jgi:predicted SAM-dependent methyltransferase